jgi:hypothetical protein
MILGTSVERIKEISKKKKRSSRLGRYGRVKEFQTPHISKAIWNAYI